MFTHVLLGADDLDASKRFYDAALGALGIGPGTQDPNGRVWWMTPQGMFGVGKPIDGAAPTHGNGSTIGFAATSPEAVKAFHDAGEAAGGRSIEDPPGLREGAYGRLHLGYLRDPAGNKVCALHRPQA